MNRVRPYIPLIGFVVPTVVVGYGVVIPRSCVAGVNELTVGFGTTILGAVLRRRPCWRHLAGFAANRYVAPMLLGERWERLDAFHGTSMAEPEWADDVVKAQAALWHSVPRGADVLRF